MTNAKASSIQDENLAKTVHDLEGKVARQEDMIKDLVRLIRMQNSEINTILQQQNKQGQEYERQYRRVSGTVEKLDGRVSSFLNNQAAAGAAEMNKQEQGKEVSDPALISSLVAKVDVLHSTLRDHKQWQQKTMQRQIDALEAKIDSLQDKMLFKKRSDEETQKWDGQPQGNVARLSNNIPGHKRTASKDVHIKFEPDDIHSTRGVRSSDTHSFSSFDLKTPSQLSDSRSNGQESQDNNAENSHHQLTSPDSKTSPEEDRNTTRQDDYPFYSKDMLNLKIRLSYAERLIGARYRTGTFTILGRSFFQDATALRYIATDQQARDTFKMFYGNRLHAIHYVDVAPPAVIAAFDIVARVRCRHEMWPDDKLEAKRQIRCAAEQIVDDWVKSLPLRETEERSLDTLSCRLQSQFNILKIMCYRNSVEFDFALPA